MLVLMKSMVLILLKSGAVFNVMAFRIRVSTFHILPFSNKVMSFVQLFFRLTESLFDKASKRLMTICCTACLSFVQEVCACIKTENSRHKNRSDDFFNVEGLTSYCVELN